MTSETLEQSGRYAATELVAFATGLFRKAGLEGKAEAVAEILVAADAMGHTTHGLALAAKYLQQITDGAMAVDGGPEVISDRGACVCWNGRRLPGVWLTAAALDLGMERSATYG